MVLKQSSQTLTWFFRLEGSDPGRCFKTTAKKTWEAEVVEFQTFPSDKSLGIRVRFLAGPQMSVLVSNFNVCMSAKFLTRITSVRG